MGGVRLLGPCRPSSSSSLGTGRPEKAEGKEETGDWTFLPPWAGCHISADCGQLWLYPRSVTVCHLGSHWMDSTILPASRKLWDRVDALTPSAMSLTAPCILSGPSSAAPLCLPLCRPVSHTAHISVHLEQIHLNFLVFKTAHL